MFKKGESGNPAGRKPGSGLSQRLRAAVGDGGFEQLVKVVLDNALTGDMRAAEILLARLVPPVRSVQEPVVFELAGVTLSEKAHSLLLAAAEGRMSTTDTKALLDALGIVAKIRETEELEQRIEALERRTP